jgi:hypothetical protein
LAPEDERVVVCIRLEEPSPSRNGECPAYRPRESLRNKDVGLNFGGPGSGTRILFAALLHRPSTLFDTSNTGNGGTSRSSSFLRGPEVYFALRSI